MCIEFCKAQGPCDFGALIGNVIGNGTFYVGVGAGVYGVAKLTAQSFAGQALPTAVATGLSAASLAGKVLLLGGAAVAIAGVCFGVFLCCNVRFKK